MLNKEDRLNLEMAVALRQEDIGVLRLLYAPLIGSDALCLYETLASLYTMPQKIKNHLLVQKISALSMESIENNRTVLEQYLLIKTYYDATKNVYLYVLDVPKRGDQFLSHDVFGRLYLRKMGKQVYEYMKRCFAQNHADMQSYQEISAHMNALFTDWDEQKEQTFSDLQPKISDAPYHFNFDLFLNGLSVMILPLSERTKENLDFIAEKADLYGIDEKEMQKLVGKSMDLKRNQLDRKKLIRYMQNSRQEFIRHVEDPYALPPVRFLQEKQNGVAVSKSDQKLIDSLLNETYHFPPQVINVLIEYVLERCDQSLSRSYVEKVASTWVRLGIDTKEKALSVIKAQDSQTKTKTNPKEKQLPKWFHEDAQIEGESDEQIDAEALMEDLRKLREQYE